ncbi:hypothetical protein ACQSSU_20510 [Micromonospora echinospora]
MRAITIQQPWAWAIAEGYKLVENRGQNARYRGEVAIHAGIPVSTGHLPDRAASVALDRLGGRGNVWDPRRFPRPLRRPASAHPTLALGAVIAVAQLVDCHPASLTLLGVCCRPWGQVVHGANARPAYHLVLADVRPLAEPVPCPGMQAVPWPIKDVAVVKAIRAQLEAAR